MNFALRQEYATLELQGTHKGLVGKERQIPTYKTPKMSCAKKYMRVRHRFALVLCRNCPQVLETLQRFGDVAQNGVECILHRQQVDECETF